jgi:hypothetical protein
MKQLFLIAFLALFAATAVQASSPVIYTKHATERLEQRQIEKVWVERVLENPDWVEPDPRNAKVRRAYGRIDEAGGMILRVVYTDVRDGRLIITQFFDDGAQRRAPAR